MRRFFSQARLVASELADLWRDRDVHGPAFWAALRSVPGRFKNADPSQRRILVGLALLVLITQVYFVLS